MVYKLVRNAVFALCALTVLIVTSYSDVNAQVKPSTVTDRDYIGRQGLNSIFGDRIGASRKADILVQFQYGISSKDISGGGSVTGTGAITAPDSLAQLSTGAGNGTAEIASIDSLRYQPGFDAWAYFTAAFSTADTGTKQYIGVFENGQNGFFVGQKNGVFGYGYIDSTTETFVPVTTDGTTSFRWNEFDPTALNIYRINYGWLGVAPDVIEVYSGTTRGWVEVGRIELLNTQNTPSISQPVNPITAYVERTSGSGAVTLRTASWGAGRIHNNNDSLPSDRQGETSNVKSIGISTDTNIVTIRNKTTFQSKTNKIVAHVDILTAAVDGTKNVTIHVRKNVTLGGTPSYADFDTANSVIEIDTAGTTITGGEDRLPLILSKTGSELISLGDSSIKVYPGETLTVSAESANASEVTVGIVWHEEF